MGVSGCGKTTIGNLIAKEFSLPFFDGDDYHPVENIKKMSNGIPLTDDDREEWLKTLNKLAIEHSTNKGCVIACSALKEKYRTILNTDIESSVKWVYLSGTFDEIFNRLSAREDHFMPPNLLKSQFETLEEPLESIKVSIIETPNQIIKTIKENIYE